MTPSLEHRINEAIDDTLAQMQDMAADLDALVLAVAFSIEAEPEDVRKVWAKRHAIGGAI